MSICKNGRGKYKRANQINHAGGLLNMPKPQKKSASSNNNRRNAKCVPFQEQPSSPLVQGSHGFAQISEGRRVVEIQFPRRVVCEHPRKHWVLGNVVEGAPGDHIQRHDVVEIGDLPSAPRFREFACLQNLERERSESDQA